MTARAYALVLAIGLPLASGAFAAATSSQEQGSARGADDQPQTMLAPVSMSWVPSWLMEPLSRAIADATDTRDRKAK